MVVHNLCMRIRVVGSKGARKRDRWDPSIWRRETRAGRNRTVSYRVHRVLGQYELCTVREMQSACGTNLALECLRMDGIARFSSCTAAHPVDCLMHMCAPSTQRYSGEYKVSVPCRRRMRARVNVPRGSLVSFSTFLLLHPLCWSLSHTENFFALSSYFTLVQGFLSLFPFYRALFHSRYMYRNTRSILFEPFA